MKKLPSYFTDQLTWHKMQAHKMIAWQSHIHRRYAHFVRRGPVQAVADVSSAILTTMRIGHG